MEKYKEAGWLNVLWFEADRALSILVSPLEAYRVTFLKLLLLGMGPSGAILKRCFFSL
jgi:hypothetical protein